MTRFKRFIRPGLVVSVVAHVAVLLVGLFFASANIFRPVPPEPMVLEIVPDAVVVEKAPPDETPRREGTASELQSSGSDLPVKSDSASAAAQPPPGKPTAQEPQQPQPPSKPQPDARPPVTEPRPAQAERSTVEPPQPEADQAAAAAMAQPDTAPTEIAEPPPAPSPSEQMDAAEMLARLALLGGRLGGGFEAPPIDTTQADYDFTAAFRERVSSCSTLPAGIGSADDVKIALRVFFNRDGTLASPPQALEPIVSAKQQALMQNSIGALQRCQPYTMLPAQKYKQWKRLDLTFYPMNFRGR